MTKDEAMKLALEALEDAKALLNGKDGTTMWFAKEITALREALAEQPAQQEPMAWKVVPVKPTDEMLKTMDECSKEGYDERLYAGHAASVYMAAVDAAPEQPQQEPVRVPVMDNTYNYAKSLAEAIFKQHFSSDEHYACGRIVWGVNDTVIGILTQIDNMVADMVRKPAQRKPLTDGQKRDLIKKSELWDMHVHIGWYSAPSKSFVEKAMQLIADIEAAHGIKEQP